MKGTVMCDDATSDPSDFLSGMKEGCVLAPTLFSIFFATLLKHALENPQKEFTSEPGQTGICLNSLDSGPKAEYMRNTSMTSYLQMMRPLQLTKAAMTLSRLTK